MSTFTRCLITVVVGFTTVAAANAQQKITLNEAIEMALENSINMQQARNNLERNDASIRGSYGQFLPNLNGSLNAQRQTGRQFDQANVTFDDFTQNSISGGISTNLPIFTGWRNISNLREAQINREAGDETFQRLREDTIFQTAQSFLQVILNKELLEIAQDNFETVQKQLEQVDAQVEVGMRPIVDLFNQEAEVANNELLVIQRRRDVNTSKVSLMRLLQLDALNDYEFVVPELETEGIIPQKYQLTELIDAAMDSRRDLRAAELNIESAEYALRSARSGYWPTLSFSAGLNTSYGDRYRVLGETISFSDQFFDQRINRSFGLSLSIPIFDRFQTRTSVVNRQIDLKNDRLALIDRQSLVYQEVRQAYEDYITLSQELVSSETALRAAEKAFETQQERYNVGSTTLIELTQANNAFFQASSRRVQTVYQFIFQEKLLDYYLGKITEDVSL